jgi:hypothetical protein
MTRYAATLSGNFDHDIIYGVSSAISDATGLTIGANQIGVDPKFVNASAAPYDFHTQAGAPGTDAGMNLSQVLIDIDNHVRPQGASADVGATEYATAGTAPVISGVFTSGITSNSAVISWTTDLASTSYAEYGPTGYTSTTSVNANLVTLHSVALSGLSPSTLYHFRADSIANGSLGVSTDYTFTTSAALVAPTSFSLSAAPSLSLAQGQSGTDAISATLLTGNPAAVSFKTSSLPAGVTASFSSTSCTATCSTSLKFSAAPNASAGTFSLAITGTGGGASASTTVTLKVTGKHHP